jgi:hypothetical protein
MNLTQFKTTTTNPANLSGGLVTVFAQINDGLTQEAHGTIRITNRDNANLTELTIRIDNPTRYGEQTLEIVGVISVEIPLSPIIWRAGETLTIQMLSDNVGDAAATVICDFHVWSLGVNAPADWIDNAAIADNAITAAKIASNAITDVKIASNAISAAKIASNAITAAKIASNAFTDVKFATDAYNKVWAVGTRTLTSTVDSTGVTTLLSRITGLLQTKAQADANHTVIVGEINQNEVKIDAIQAKTNLLAFTSGNVHAQAQVVTDKTDYGLVDGAVTTAKIQDGALTAAKFSGPLSGLWSNLIAMITGSGLSASYTTKALENATPLLEETELQFGFPVKRSPTDENPITFSFYGPSLTLVGTRSINNGAYEPISGAVAYLRTDSEEDLYTLSYNAADRPIGEGTVRYRFVPTGWAPGGPERYVTLVVTAKIGDATSANQQVIFNTIKRVSGMQY